MVNRIIDNTRMAYALSGVGFVAPCRIVPARC